MRRLSKLKMKKLLTGTLNVKFVIEKGDSSIYNVGDVVIVQIDVLQSPMLANATSVQEAFYNLTMVMDVSKTFDEMLKKLNDDEYHFNVLDGEFTNMKTVRDEVLAYKKYKVDNELVSDSDTKFTIYDLLRTKSDFNLLNSYLYETADDFTLDDDFNYQIEYNEETREYDVED